MITVRSLQFLDRKGAFFQKDQYNIIIIFVISFDRVQVIEHELSNDIIQVTSIYED